MNPSPAESDDKSARQRRVRGSLWFTVPGTFGSLGAAYLLVPPLAGLIEPGERLVFAARWLLVAFIPYAAVCLTILYQRFAEGAHNPLLGVESERLKVHCRVMQNTLEQLVWFAFCVLPLATLLSSTEARLIPILCVFFALARFVYWWGYLRSGTLGRAPGVQLTFLLNIPLLVAVLVRFAKSMLS
ncbi:MAG: MAPEG family protein [Betaproteobacteria bacterium]|nr:MAG: MAPEG family protein [Betaproteobacteria bacterium]